MTEFYEMKLILRIYWRFVYDFLILGTGYNFLDFLVPSDVLEIIENLKKLV